MVINYIPLSIARVDHLPADLYAPQLLYWNIAGLLKRFK
jgi:hypothetical protein